MIDLIDDYQVQTSTRVLSKKAWNLTKTEAENYKNIHNRIFSNKYRDADINDGDKTFIVKKDKMYKGKYAVWQSMIIYEIKPKSNAINLGGSNG